MVQKGVDMSVFCCQNFSLWSNREEGISTMTTVGCNCLLTEAEQIYDERPILLVLSLSVRSPRRYLSRRNPTMNRDNRSNVKTEETQTVC